MMPSSDTAASAAVRRATAAFVLLSAVLAIGVAVLVIIGAVQQFAGVATSPLAESALSYLFIVIPLLIIAVIVRWRVVGRPRRNT